MVRSLLGRSALALLAIATPAQAASPPEARVQWVAPDGAGFRTLTGKDERLFKAEQLADNEAAHFLRRLYALARPGEPLVVSLEQGGQTADLGLFLDGRQRPGQPFIHLAPTEKALSTLFLHEGAHALHFALLGGKPAHPAWQDFPHSTFAVTTREEALAEGYAEHLETLLGYYGQDTRQRAFYDHQAPAFGVDAGPQAEFFFPLRDLWTYSQTRARYGDVRDGLTAFMGPGGFARAQLDPARDRSALRPAGQMLACEGVVATTLFWLSVRQAGQAKPGGGLLQPDVLAGEARLLDALRAACKAQGAHASIRSVVEAYRKRDDGGGRDVWLDVTRGATAAPGAAATWRTAYLAAVAADAPAIQLGAQRTLLARQQLVADIAQSPTALWRYVGPVLPVGVPGRTYALMHDTGHLHFDLNAAGPAELLDSGLPAAAAARILKQRDGAPFTSWEDARRRVGKDLGKLSPL